MYYDKNKEINELKDRAQMLAIFDIYDRIEHIENIIENIEQSIDKLNTKL